RCACFSPDGKLFATGGQDKRILVYDVPPAGSKFAELREKTVLDTHRGAVACLAFSPDGKLLASGADTATKTGPAELKVWDVAKAAEVASWTEHTSDVAAVCFHPSRPLLVSGGADPG